MPFATVRVEKKAEGSKQNHLTLEIGDFDPTLFGSMIHIMIHQDYFTLYFVIPLLNYILQVKILKF